MGANTTHGYFYKPSLGASGTAELALFDDALDATDLVIKSNVDGLAGKQPLDAGLTSIAGLTTAANKMIYTTGLDTYAVASLTAFARSILDDADEATFKATVNLEIGTDVQAFDNALTSISGLAYVSASFIKLTANDTYAVRTIAQVKTDISLNNVENLKVKLDGTAAPTVNDDNTQGYAVGSRWIDITNDKEYVALDVSTGAAVWTETTGGGYTNLTSFVDQTAWRVFYSNIDGDVVELALGTDGQYLKSNGAAVAPTWAVPAGAGDVTKVGTPVDSQVGVWTGDGTIEGAASLTYDGSNLQLTGDIGATGARITKGWFANLETTGDLTVNGTALASTYATLGANTNITSILNTGLYVGRDADNQIKFATDNKIVFRVNAADKAEMISTGELDMNTGSIGFTQQTISYNVTTTTVNWTLGNKATMTFGAGNIGTFAFTNPTNPCNVVLKVIQDGTGSRVVTAWDADIKWAGGSAPTLTTGANTIDILSFYFDGTNFFGVASLAFS